MLLGVASLLASTSAANGAPPADACALLTAAQVSAALGVTAGEGKAVVPSLCQWTAPGKDRGSERVAVTIGNAQKFAYAKTPVNSPSIKKIPVSGVGDEAVFGTTAGQAASINVKKGDVYFAVSLMGVPLDKAQAVATTLAKDILAKL
jgi:hypothetical protein